VITVRVMAPGRVCYFKADDEAGAAYLLDMARRAGWPADRL
jgi:hypothetical protein